MSFKTDNGIEVPIIHQSILDSKTLEFSSSEAGIRVKTLKKVNYREVEAIHSCLKLELEQIGFTITYRFIIYPSDGTANINFTVRKIEGEKWIVHLSEMIKGCN